LSAGKRQQLLVVPGVEISAETTVGTLHLLGYFIDHHNEILNQTLVWMQEQRKNRNFLLVEKLTKLGILIDFEQVKRIAGSEVIGRPHFASILEKMGVVVDFHDAFQRFLGPSGKAYIPKVRMDPERAILAIRAAGGVPVLAHPVDLTNDFDYLENHVKRLCDMGLEGIEVWYPKHLDREVLEYQRLAEKYHLVMTGGSDFHGANKPHLDLGVGEGNLDVRFDVVEQLIERQKNITG